MYRDGIGRLQLHEHVRRVLHRPTLKVHGDDLVPVVHLDDDPDVPVEDAHARVGVVLAPPHDVVVVAHLHHPVALPEDVLPKAALRLAGLGRVHRLLDAPVEGRGAGGVPPGGREHLNLVGRDSHLLGQTGLAQLHDGVRHPHRVGAA